MFATPPDSQQEFQTPEEAEAVLRQLASSLMPADTGLRELITAMANSDPDVDADAALLPVASRSRIGAETELRKAELRYRALVEQIPAVTFMAPLDGSTSELYVSPQIERLLGFSAKEWLDDPVLWYRQLHPDDQGRWQEAFSATCNSGKHFRSEYRFISRDGRVVWVHGEAQVVTDDLGRPLFLQGVAFDITEAKEAEERLRQNNAQLAAARDQALAASRTKSAFLANMSHELRTPLSAILGFSEILQDELESEGLHAVLPDLEKIQNSANHLLRLISGILDLSKVEAGKTDLNLETFDLEGLIYDVLTTVQPLAEKGQNELDVRLAPNLGTVRADVTKIRQILYNLLSNASKFTERGTITLEATRLPGPNGGMVRMRVRDTGIGIPEDQLGKLFQSFVQVDDSSTRKYGGTGLGLAISQRFCKLMGGDITVASQIGQGTTFTVELPAIVEILAEDGTGERNDAGLAPVESAATEPSGPEEPTLLVVDGDGAAFDAVHGDGRRVLPVAAPEAARLVQETQPSAIALFVRPGSSDGWTALAALKALPATATVPIFVAATDDDHTRGFAFPATEFLATPTSPGALAALLRSQNRATGNVLVIADRAERREETVRAIHKAGWTATEASSGLAAFNVLAHERPDLIAMDLLMPETDGMDFTRLLRKTQAGRDIPVAILVPASFTADERRRLGGIVERNLHRSGQPRAEMLREVRSWVEERLPQESGGRRQEVGSNGLSHRSAVAVAPPAPPPMPAAPPSPAWPEVLEAQRRLALLTGERDALLAQEETREREAAERERELAEARDRQEKLETELGQFRHQLGEQRQSVELLRGEYEDTIAQLQSIDRIRQEADQLRGERDAALSQLRQAPPPRSEPSLPPVVVHELEEMRRQQQEMRLLLERFHTTPPPPPTPVAVVAPVEPKPLIWFVGFRDEFGRSHARRGTTAEIRQWLSSGALTEPDSAVASRSESGPFEPLFAVAEFRDLGFLAAGPRVPGAISPARQSVAAASVGPAGPLAMPEWVKWIALVGVAVATGLLGLKLLPLLH